MSQNVKLQYFQQTHTPSGNQRNIKPVIKPGALLQVTRETLN